MTADLLSFWHLDSVCSLTLFPSRCTIMVAAYT
jgi:hypothetical protein